MFWNLNIGYMYVNYFDRKNVCIVTFVTQYIA